MPSLTVANFKPVLSGAMIGFYDVTLPSGMVLYRCSAFAKGGRVWAAPPSKQVIARDGSVLRGPDGKAKYEQVVDFVDRRTRERWSEHVVAALRETFPNALPQSGPDAAPLPWQTPGAEAGDRR